MNPNLNLATGASDRSRERENRRTMMETSEQDDQEDLLAELEAELERDAGVNLRPVTEGEVSVNKWAQGDPAKAMGIADSLGERRARALKKFALVQAVYDAKLAVLNTWLADYEQRAGKEVAWIDGLLDLYQQDFHPDERTTRLPSVTLQRRTQGNVREWVDEDKALRYQQQVAPEDVTRTLSKSALLKRLSPPEGDAPFAPAVGYYVDKDTGEVVDFVRDLPPEAAESFTVKPVKEEGE